MSRRWAHGRAQHKSMNYENPTTGATCQTLIMNLHNTHTLTDGHVIETPPKVMTSIYQPATSSNSSPRTRTRTEPANG